MLMIGVRQAQQAFRLIATRLSAAGQRPLPLTEIDQHRQTGRENMLLHSPAAHRLTDWSEKGNFNCCCRHANKWMLQQEPSL